MKAVWFCICSTRNFILMHMSRGRQIFSSMAFKRNLSRSRGVCLPLTFIPQVTIYCYPKQRSQTSSQLNVWRVSCETSSDNKTQREWQQRVLEQRKIPQEESEKDWDSGNSNQMGQRILSRDSRSRGRHNRSRDWVRQGLSQRQTGIESEIERDWVRNRDKDGDRDGDRDGVKHQIHDK